MITQERILSYIATISKFGVLDITTNNKNLIYVKMTPPYKQARKRNVTLILDGTESVLRTYLVISKPAIYLHNKGKYSKSIEKAYRSNISLGKTTLLFLQNLMVLVGDNYNGDIPDLLLDWIDGLRRNEKYKI